MPTGYQIKDQEAVHYFTLQIVRWVDIFTRPVYKDIVIDSMKFCQKEKDLEIYAYVIMTNHIHIIAKSGIVDLSGTIRDFKKFTSKKIIEKIQEIQESRDWMLDIFKFEAEKHKRNTGYQLWTHENHAVYLYSNDFINEKIEYIHENPVRAGIVENAEDYLYSSARNYACLDSVLEIVTLAMPWKTYG